MKLFVGGSVEPFLTLFWLVMVIYDLDYFNEMLLKILLSTIFGKTYSLRIVFQIFFYSMWFFKKCCCSMTINVLSKKKQWNWCFAPGRGALFQCSIPGNHLSKHTCLSFKWSAEHQSTILACCHTSHPLHSLLTLISHSKLSHFARHRQIRATQASRFFPLQEMLTMLGLHW